MKRLEQGQCWVAFRGLRALYRNLCGLSLLQVGAEVRPFWAGLEYLLSFLPELAPFCSSSSPVTFCVVASSRSIISYPSYAEALPVQPGLGNSSPPFVVNPGSSVPRHGSEMNGLFL